MVKSIEQKIKNPCNTCKNWVQKALERDGFVNDIEKETEYIKFWYERQAGYATDRTAAKKGIKKVKT